MANRPTTITTGKVRLSYEHLIKPYAMQPGAEEKYSTTMLIPKSDVDTKMKIDAAIQAATQEGIQSKWNGSRPAQVPVPIYDGDGVRPNGEAFGDECKGHWVMTASSKQQPEIVDINLQRILLATEIYSGMYARLSLNFFAYSAAGKKGIGCGLGPVQKLADGEPLGGRISAADAFGSPAPQQSVQQAQSAYQQQQPNYAQPQQQYQPAQSQQMPPVQQAPQQQTQIDPITGKPMTGGVYGI